MTCYNPKQKAEIQSHQYFIGMEGRRLRVDEGFQVEGVKMSSWWEFAGVESRRCWVCQGLAGVWGGGWELVRVSGFVVACVQTWCGLSRVGSRRCWVCVGFRVWRGGDVEFVMVSTDRTKGMGQVGCVFKHPTQIFKIFRNFLFRYHFIIFSI